MEMKNSPPNCDMRYLRMFWQTLGYFLCSELSLTLPDWVYAYSVSARQIFHASIMNEIGIRNHKIVYDLSIIKFPQ